MATNFNPATKISVSGPLSISDKRSADMPLDIRGRIETLTDITTVPFAWEGMLVYVRDTKKYYKVTSLANRTVGGVAIPYYPATWVEFGSGGSTPSPTPSEIDAGDVSYFSSGTFSNNTVGKELQSLASNILSLAEGIHNLNGDIGDIGALGTENKQDLVSAINEVLASTGSTIAVVNNLLSDSTTDALSAYQGKVLKGLVDGKVAGIKVQGESSILPMDSNGIVIIPAGGGGGTGTITGATVGGNPVIASGGILQFDAYPTVPITSIETSDHTPLAPNNGLVTLPAIPNAPTADTMQYSDSNSYSDGSIGKALKDIRKPGASLNSNFKYAVSRSGDPTLTECLNAMWDELHPVEATDPIPVSPTVVDLDGYDETDDSFTYDDGTVYIYGVSNTSKVVYNDDGTDYAVFKVNDVDKYIRYEITESGGTITYTCEDVYTLNNLPSEARSLFEISKYAAVKVITGTKTDYFYKDRYAVFVDSDNRPMQNDFYEATESNTTVKYALFKSNSNGDLYLYKANSLLYKFQSKITSSDASYSTLDAHFGASSADKISYNDSVSRMDVSNVQQAIQHLAIGISEGFSDVTITLKTNEEQPIANQAVTIAVTYRGETYDLTTQSSYNNGFTTDSNGHIALYLPLGAVYQISFHQYNVNYSTPDTLNGIIDTPICNLTGLYVALNDNEAVLINVNVLNASPAITPNDKEAYIDFYISDDWVHSYTAVLSSVGTPKTIKDTQGNVIKSGNNYVTIDIPKNTQFRVRLQLWDTSLTEEEQIYIASSNVSKIASNVKSVINLSYTYALPGLYLVVKDSNTEKGYAEYKILGIDSTNNTMEITINGINYTLSKDSSNNIYRKETNSADSPVQWFTQSSSSDILGVGIRSTGLINNSMNDEYTYNLGYTNCCFRVSRNFIEFNAQIATVGYPNIVTYHNVDGMFQTRKLASFSETQTFPAAQKAIRDYKQTLNTASGSVIIDGFIPTKLQIDALKGNYSSLMFVLPFINGTTLYYPYKNNQNYTIGCSHSTAVTTIGSSGNNYNVVQGDLASRGIILNTDNTNFFVFYPF